MPNEHKVLAQAIIFSFLIVPSLIETIKLIFKIIKDTKE